MSGTASKTGRLGLFARFVYYVQALICVIIAFPASWDRLQYGSETYDALTVTSIILIVFSFVAIKLMRMDLEQPINSDKQLSDSGKNLAVYPSLFIIVTIVSLIFDSQYLISSIRSTFISLLIITQAFDLWKYYVSIKSNKRNVIPDANE